MSSPAHFLSVSLFMDSAKEEYCQTSQNDF